MLITGHSPDNIRPGNTLTRDRFPEKTFTYALSNPPYGVDYSEEYDAVKAEHETGVEGRFAPGIPRKSDGQLLVPTAHAQQTAAGSANCRWTAPAASPSS